MIHLAWALSKVLENKPSNPIRYMAYQLLRWKYGDVPRKEKERIQNLIVNYTIAMDQTLLVSYRFYIKEEYIYLLLFNILKNKKKSTKIMNDTSENNLKDNVFHYEILHRMERGVWRYKKIQIPKYGICDFPSDCTNCKLETCEWSDACSDCRIDTCSQNLEN